MFRAELLACNAPPFDIGPDTLFVAYNASAELKCFLTRSWQFPAHVYDPYIAYRAESNLLLPYVPDEKRVKPRRRLSDACRAYGIKGWENIDKEALARDIGNGQWQKCGKEGVLDYCEEDVRNTAELLRRQIRGYGPFPPANMPLVLHWSNYAAKAVAMIEARGIPIDVELWNLVQENKAAVIGELLRQFDPSYGSEDPIYTPEGEWSYARFAR